MQGSRRWRIGPFEVDSREHRLMQGDRAVPVTRKAFALLVTLLGRPGQLFTKAELFDTVWAGSVVTDAALSRAIRELRLVLGDDASAPRYIATAHGVGFRFVAPVSLESEPPAPTQAEARSAAPLAGRERELARLDAALAQASAGRRQTLFVTGEAGIGKTALVETFIAARPAEVWAVQGRCIDQYGTGEAYLPILEALEQLARRVGAATIAPVLLRFAPMWLAQLPWLAHDVDPAALRRAVADATAQRMLREIAHALEVLAADRTIVLWLEDLHWSDPSSLDFVSFLAGRRDPARLLLIGSLRPFEAKNEASTLHALVHRLRQGGQADELALGSLDAAHVRQYLDIRFERPIGVPVHELSAFLHRRSDGNALFTVAMVDDLVRRRALTRDAGAWVLNGSVSALGVALPDSLRHLVHDQIERLPKDERRLIEAAAVTGADFAAAAVAAALEDDLAEVEEGCMRLAQQGRFLRAHGTATWPDGTTSATFGFLHALYGQVIGEGVPQSRRAEWQQRIGLRQELAHGDQCGPIAAELAMRFEAARDPERTFRYLLMAGAGALAQCAYQECIDHLRGALARVSGLPVGLRPRLELDALLPLGAALMMVQGYASSEVETTYQRALELCRLCGQPGDLERVQRGLWNVRFSRADLEGARAAAEELLSHVSERGDAGPVFDALAKLGHTCLHSGDFADAREHLERALALPDVASTAVYQRELPRLLAYLSWVLWYLGLADQAVDCSVRSLAAAGPDVSVHTRALVLGHACWVRWLRGETEEAARLGEQQRALSIEHGLVYWRVWGEFMLGLTAATQGRVDAGVAAMSTASETMRSLGTVVGTTSWMYLRAEIELAAGRPGRARAALVGSSDLLECGSHARNAAETARVEAELALSEDAGPAGRARAEECFLAAIRIARSQRAPGLELRAAMGLARLWASDDQAVRAIELLTDVYSAFGEGLQTADLLSAKALLDALRRSAIAAAS